MPEIRGITVSVGRWYADLLRITLVRNMRHMTECLVVTAPGDPAVEVAREVPGVRVFETDKFFLHGAMFNKGLALESGFDVIGRYGYLLIFDADILLPPSLPLDRLNPEALHGAKRRILEDASLWREDLDWSSLPLHKDGGPVGFAQLFRCDCAALRGKSPWYDVTFGHCGGGDAYFIEHWKRARAPVVMLPVEVLHLGPPDCHWFGTSPEAQDMMAKFVTENGWRRAAAKFTPEQAARAGEVAHRVAVPGYPPSTFELPFVQRARGRRP